MKNNQNYKTINAYRYLLDQYEANKDKEAACKICDMLLSGELSATPRKDSKLLFVENRYTNSKCKRCNKNNAVKEGVFCLNREAWCIACSSEQDRELPAFKKYLRNNTDVYVPPVKNTPVPTQQTNVIPLKNENEYLSMDDDEDENFFGGK